MPPESTPSRIGFGADLASAARALISQPSVPLISLAAMVLPTVILLPFAHHGIVLLIGFVIVYAILFFNCGWYGAERVFFQRKLEGKPVALRHLLGLVSPFIGRFFVVGVPFAIVLILLFGVLFSGHRPQEIRTSVWFSVSMIVFFVAMDFALTFVTPALAYTTRSALRALGIGLAMIRQTWPRCALYVLCPPLALNLLHLVYPVGSPAVGLAISSVLVVVSFLAKGAIAAFYLRERGSYSDEGAACITSQDEPPGYVSLTTPIRHRPSNVRASRRSRALR